MVKRVKLSFDRYIKRDCKGRRSGRPRFKGVGRYRTFTYPQVKGDCVVGNRIKLPKIGTIKFVKHRAIPDSAKIKTVSITRKADGYYLTLSLDVVFESIPTLIEKVGAIDLGLIDFLVDSDGESITTPQVLSSI
ncbi:MAG: transposase [Cyanobacteria bacterium J083]|nr:MAG: transposase [Cyanobacteria bacterium J083]